MSVSRKQKSGGSIGAEAHQNSRCCQKGRSFNGNGQSSTQQSRAFDGGDAGNSFQGHSLHRLPRQSGRKEPANASGRGGSCSGSQPRKPVFSQILAGISEIFGESDLSVLIADTKDHATAGKRVVDYFLDSQIDGMICLDGALSDEEIRQFEENGVNGRIVFACEWKHGSSLPSVRSDNNQGARLAVRHLYELGHRKIAHVTGPQDNVLTHVRREGMLAERAELGLPVRDEWIIRGDFSLESGRSAAERILSMEDRPTAIFCASDQVAFGLISTLRMHGMKVPEDVSVVGFDDIELSEFYVPALTTVRQDRHALGTSAARLLLECIHADGAISNKHSGPVMIDVNLVVRQSAASI